MATNPFNATPFKKSEDLPKSSADVPSAKESSKGVTRKFDASVLPDPKTRPDRSSKENAERAGSVVKEGLYAELSADGKLLVNRDGVSSKDSGPTVVSSRTPQFNQENKPQDLTYSSSVIRNVEKGEPYPVTSSVTGESYKDRTFTADRPSNAVMREIARRELEARRQAKLNQLREFDKTSIIPQDRAIMQTEQAPVSFFADVNSITLLGVGRKNLDRNPQLALFLEKGGERKINQESISLKSDLIKKEIGGGKVTDTIYGGVAPVRLISEGISGLRGSKSRRKIVEELYAKEFENLGVYDSKISKRLSFSSVFVGDTVESGALIVGPELTSERLAGGSLAKVLTGIGKVEVKSSFKPILQKSILPAMKLGAREGAESVAFQNIASGKDIQPFEVAFGAGFGAISTPVFLSLPLAFQPTKPTVSKILRGTGEALEFGQETGGDILASRTKIFSNLGDVKLTQKVERIGGKDFVSFEGNSVRSPRVVSPSFVDVFTGAKTPSSVPSVVPSNVPSITSTRSSLYSLTQSNTPSNIPALTFTPIDSNVDLNVPFEEIVEVPVEVPSVVPSVVNSVVPTVVSASGLPLVPPIFDMRGEGRGRSSRQGRKYFNELQIGLSLLGSPKKQSKKISAKSKKRDARFKVKNFGFGGLGEIRMGRI